MIFHSVHGNGACAVGRGREPLWKRQRGLVEERTATTRSIGRLRLCFMRSQTVPGSTVLMNANRCYSVYWLLLNCYQKNHYSTRLTWAYKCVLLNCRCYHSLEQFRQRSKTEKQKLSCHGHLDERKLRLREYRKGSAKQSKPDTITMMLLREAKISNAAIEKGPRSAVRCISSKRDAEQLEYGCD